jgi:hypothetical protein
MRKLLLVFSIIIFHLTAISQKDLSGKISMEQKRTDSILKNLDSVNSALRKTEDSLSKAEENEIFQETLEQNSRNLDAYLAERKAMEKKQLQHTYIRLILGVLFAVILFIGLRRKTKTGKQ